VAHWPAARLCPAAAHRGRARRGAAAARARRRLGFGLKGDAARESGAGATWMPRRTSVGLRRSPSGGRRWLGPDELRTGWHRAMAAGGPGRAGLRFGPSWAAGPKQLRPSARIKGAKMNLRMLGHEEEMGCW
jgi:hypothetical protein